MAKDFNYLRYLSVKQWLEMQNVFLVFLTIIHLTKG